MVKMTKREIIAELKKCGWTCARGLWFNQKHGLKRFTRYGLTLREAASIECLSASESLSKNFRK